MLNDSEEKVIIETLKDNIRTLRKKHNYTQTDLAKKMKTASSGHTVVATWENTGNTTLPSLLQVIGLSRIFDTDIDFMIGKEKIKSKDNEAIAHELNMSSQTISKIKCQKEYGLLLETIVESENVLSIADKLFVHGIMNNIMETHFAPELTEKIKLYYNQWLELWYETDTTIDNFKLYLAAKLKQKSPLYKTNPLQYINDYFLPNAKCYLSQKYNSYETETIKNQQTYIIETIADISYDYLCKEEYKLIYEERAKNELFKLFQTYIEKRIKEVHKKSSNITTRLDTQK